MGNALGSAGQFATNQLSGLADTGAGIRDFLAGPGSADQPIIQQILGSVLGAALFSEAPGLLAKINADKQARIDQDQRGLDQYLSLPEGREALGSGAMDSLQGLFPRATLPMSVPVEAGPVPVGMNAVATGPEGGPTTGSFILPMSPEQRAASKMRAFIDAQEALFPIGAYEAAGAQAQVSDSGDIQVQGQVRPRGITEMLAPADEIDPENLRLQGLVATETRFADPRGVPLVLLETDKAAEAARIQQAKTGITEASAMRKADYQAGLTKGNIDYREQQIRSRPEKPAKKPAPKAGDFKRKVVDALLKKKLAGKPFTPQESELYDKLIARPREYELYMGGTPVAPAPTDEDLLNEARRRAGQ